MPDSQSAGVRVVIEFAGPFLFVASHDTLHALLPAVRHAGGQKAHYAELLRPPGAPVPFGGDVLRVRIEGGVGGCAALDQLIDLNAMTRQSLPEALLSQRPNASGGPLHARAEIACAGFTVTPVDIHTFVVRGDGAGKSEPEVRATRVELTASVASVDHVVVERLAGGVGAPERIALTVPPSNRGELVAQLRYVERNLIEQLPKPGEQIGHTADYYALYPEGKAEPDLYYDAAVAPWTPRLEPQSPLLSRTVNCPGAFGRVA